MTSNKKKFKCECKNESNYKMINAVILSTFIVIRSNLKLISSLFLSRFRSFVQIIHCVILNEFYQKAILGTLDAQETYLCKRFSKIQIKSYGK